MHLSGLSQDNVTQAPAKRDSPSKLRYKIVVFTP
jgi:hypothetical protein